MLFKFMTCQNVTEVQDNDDDDDDDDDKEVDGRIGMMVVTLS